MFNKWMLKNIGWVASVSLLGIILIPSAANGGNSWFSKVYEVDEGGKKISVFDVVISLHNNPSSGEQTKYEDIARYWADAVCEQSNGAHKLGKVRFFRTNKHSVDADVRWMEKERIGSHPAGFGKNGKHIIFADVFSNGYTFESDKNMLDDPECAGYTLGHEWGHYVYGLFDEHGRTTECDSTKEDCDKSHPQYGDKNIDPSIMNKQCEAKNNQFRWLNHSAQIKYSNNSDKIATAQGRVWGKSGWDILIQDPALDGKSGDASTQPKRTRYETLMGREPTAPSWIKIELPGSRTECRNQLQIIWMQDNLEMQVVIDHSFTMNGEPLANAKQAAKTLVDVVPGSTAIGIVKYSTEAEQIQPIIAISDPGNAKRALIKNAIDSIVVDRLTYMYNAAKLALDNLKYYAAFNHTEAGQVVFLLTDGKEEEDINIPSKVDLAWVKAAYQAANVPIMTFGYGGFADVGVLKQLASSTGGEFFSSPTTLQQIQAAFLAANAVVSGSATLASQSKTVPAGAASSQNFVVDSTLDKLSVVVTYAGAPGDVALILRGPGGALISGVEFQCSQIISDTTCYAYAANSVLTTVGAGQWSVGMTNNSNAPINVAVNAVGVPLAVRTYAAQVTLLDGNTVTYPKPVALVASISQGYPITGAQLIATMTAPSGQVVPIPMNDAGDNGDAISGDGIYSTVIDYKENGIYKVDVQVNNNMGAAQFTMAGLQFSADMNGDTPAPVPLPAITENFTRTTTTQFTVQGWAADDHGNNPANPPSCKAMNADNADVAGMIDFAGDIDCFRIENVDLSKDLAVRVTDLGLGMKPMLAVYRADGATQVITGTLDKAASANGYVFLTIPKADLDPAGAMVATVAHSDNAATQGVYAVSAGAAIVSDAVSFDLNGDGQINCSDLAIVKASFGKRSGASGFDAQADVNHDGVVNVRDLSIAARNLVAGTKCP